MTKLLEHWPVIRFRPEEHLGKTVNVDGRERSSFEEYGLGHLLRYDEETLSLIEDDGKEGLAFVTAKWTPFTFYVEFPHHDNIVKSWHDTPIRRNSWHYETRDGKTNSGKSYEDASLSLWLRGDASAAAKWGRARLKGGCHPNMVAKAIAWELGIRGCNNGVTVLSPASSKGGNCAWCANDDLGHRRDKARDDLYDAENALEQYLARQSEINEELQRLTANLPDLRANKEAREEEVRALASD